jgi:hypothetical protein
MNAIQQIESLVLDKAARLQCDDHATSQFNLAKAINHFLLRHLNKTYSSTQSLGNLAFYILNNIHFIDQSLFNPITQMFKTLIISNTRLLNNRDHTEIEESSSVWYFLFYAIYQLQYRNYAPPDIFVNMRCYQAVIDLLLFSIQCQKQANHDENWAQESLFDILRMISTDEVINQSTLFIQSVQWKILEIVVNENALTSTPTWQEDEDNAFRVILSTFIKSNRLYTIIFLYIRLQNVGCYFNKSNNIRQNVNMLTGSSQGRRLFKIFLDEKPLKSWLISKDLLFLLLQKKERTLLEKILRSSSFFINQVDEDGNDPLLYICLKVRGCRHRIIKFLITIGCDLQRRNVNGENFFDAIQLRRNRSLLEDLLKDEIIKIDGESGQIQLNLYSDQQTIESPNENTLTH